MDIAKSNFLVGLGRVREVMEVRNIGVSAVTVWSAPVIVYC